MNIGIDIRALQTVPRTGVGEYTFGLLTELFEKRQAHQYVLFSNGMKSNFVLDKALQYPHVRHVHTKYPNKLLNRSMLYARYPKTDALVSKDLDIWLSPNLGFTALSKKVKHIQVVHDLSFELMPDMFSKKRRMWHREIDPKKQCQQADNLVVPSQQTKRDLMQVYDIPEENITVIPPVIKPLPPATDQEINKVRTTYGLPPEFMLFLGTIEPRKNIEAMLDALDTLGKDAPTLVIAGAKGWESAALVQRMKKHKKVIHIGYVPAKEKAALYAAATLFVYPSWYEGFGMPPLEAMAAGTPVLTTSRGSLPEVCADAASYANPADPQTLAQQMKIMYNSGHLRNRLKKKGELRVAYYQTQDPAAQLCSLFNALS